MGSKVLLGPVYRERCWREGRCNYMSRLVILVIIFVVIFFILPWMSRIFIWWLLTLRIKMTKENSSVTSRYYINSSCCRLRFDLFVVLHYLKKCWLFYGYPRERGKYISHFIVKLCSWFSHQNAWQIITGYSQTHVFTILIPSVLNVGHLWCKMNDKLMSFSLSSWHQVQ